MSNASNDMGRGFEYALINVLHNHIVSIRNVRIIDNSSLEANKRAWSTLNNDIKEKFVIAADSSIKTLFELEPNIEEIEDDELLLSLLKDESGTKGDVRDIVISRKSIDWEIGISAKHNYDAVKHNRISPKIDFGNNWYGLPCSKKYWNDVEPVFEKIKKFKDSGLKWSEIGDKENDIYVPLLQAFIDEIKRSYESDKNLPCKMVEYLIGIKDYYKIICKDNKRLTLIQAYNLHGTLNKDSSQKSSSIKVPIVELPTEMVAIKFKEYSKNTVELYLNNGWQLNFRLHNASTYVENSLKFDIQLVGSPTSIMSFECHWGEPSKIEYTSFDF